MYIYTVCMLTHVWLFATPWTVVHQTPLSMGLARQETLEWVACPPPGHLPDPGIQPASLMSPASAGGFFTTCTTSEAQSEGVSWSVVAWDPMNCSLPGSSVHGILQARMLDWKPFPSSEDLPDPGIKPRSPALQANSLPSEPPGKR